MRKQIAAVIILALPLIPAAFGAPADIRPFDPGTPVFRIFLPTPMKGDPSRLTFDNAHPLLVVSAVRDLRLADDRKGVQITLNDDDARAFAILTRKYHGGDLLLESNGRVLEALHVTAPSTNGVISFKYPEDAVVADYLRKRFRIGEFK
jgi:hypothetical protein